MCLYVQHASAWVWYRVSKNNLTNLIFDFSAVKLNSKHQRHLSTFLRIYYIKFSRDPNNSPLRHYFSELKIESEFLQVRNVIYWRSLIEYNRSIFYEAIGPNWRINSRPFYPVPLHFPISSETLFLMGQWADLCYGGSCHFF